MDIKNWFKKIFSKKVSLLVLVVAMLAAGLFASNTFADVGVNITPAIGATAISIDTTSAPGGSNSWTSLGSISGPVISEVVVGEIAVGTHTLTLPAGWAFNTGQNITIGLNGDTDLALSSVVVTPTTATTLVFTVTHASSTNPAVLTFSEIQVKPTGTLVSTGNMTHSGALISGVTDGVTNFGTFTTVPGTATQIKVETAADGSGTVVPVQDLVAGTSLTAYSIRRDQFGNFIDNSASTWSLTGGTGGVNELTDLTPLAPATGLSATMTGHLVGTAKIHAANGSLTSVESGTITVTPGAAQTLTILTQPASGGGSVDDKLLTQPVISVVDQYGNNVVDGTVVTAVLTDGHGALRNVTATTVSGVAKFTDLGYSKSGEIFSMEFTSNGKTTGDSSDVASMTPGALTSITLSPNPTTITADDTQIYAAEGYDRFNNDKGDITGSTTFDIDLGAGGSWAGATYTAEKTGTWTVTGTKGGVTGTATLIVNPGAIDHFTVVGIANPQTAGDLTSPVVTAYDAENNIKTDYTGTITFTSSDAGVSTVLPIAYPFTTGAGSDNGVHTFTNGVQLTTSGTQSVTVTGDAKTGSQVGIVVNPAAAETLTFAPAPASIGTVDAILTTQPVVHVVDQYGNNVVDGTVVTASLDSSSGTLLGTLTASTASGVAMFTDLGYTKIDSFKIIFTTNSKTLTSGALSMTAGAPKQVNVETKNDGTGEIVPTQTITADQTLTAYSITRDQYDNFVANAAADTWSLPTKTGGVANGDLMAAGDKKSAVFSGNLVGTAVIDAAIAGLTSHDSGTITVVPGALASIVVSPDTATINADQTQTYTAEGFDHDGNSRGSVTGDTTFSIVGGLDGGSWTANVYNPHTVGVYVVRGTDGAFSDDTTSLTVTPGAAKTLTVAGITDPITAGTVSDVTVTAKDQFDNTATGYTGTIKFTSSDAGVSTVLPIAYPFTTGAGGDNGVHSFSPGVTLTTAGEQTVTATDTVTATITGSQIDITVNHAALYQLDVSASPSNLPVNTISTITVTGQDRYENTTISDSTTRVHLTVDNGNLGAAGRTLSAGVATTTLTNAIPTTTLVSVIDLSNLSILDDETTVTFTAIGAPAISVVTVGSITQSGAVINFTSDRIGKSRVDYGTTTSYGFSTQYPSANNMTADANNNITLGGLNCGTTYYYNIYAKSVSDVESTSSGHFDTLACPSAVIPTIVLNGPAIVSAYKVSEADARFAAGLQFTVTNDASITVNGASVSSVAGVVTAASNAEAKTLGAHVYNVVVTSSTGNTAELTVGYQVNADDVVPVIPTISLVGDPIVSAYVLADANTRFASGLQFNVTNDHTITVNGATVSSVAGVVDAVSNVTAVTLGAHTYHVVVTSTTGHTAEMTVAYQVNADIVTPVIPTISLLIPASIVNAYTASEAETAFASGLQFTTTFATSAKVNGADAVIGGGGVVTATDEEGATAPGAHTYNVVVTSSTGNTAEITVAYAVNPNPPVIQSVSLDKPAYKATQDGDMAITVVIKDDTASAVKINGNDATPTGGGNWTYNLAHEATPGEYSFNVTATSDYGTANALITYAVIADDAAPAPTVTVTDPGAGQVIGGDYGTAFNTNGFPPVDGHISIDGGSWISTGSPYVIDTTSMANGSHTIRAKDTVDGTTGYSDYITFIVNNVDTVPPTVGFNGSSDQQETSIVLHFTSSEDGTAYAQYGLTDEYGSQSSLVAVTSGAGAVTLAGLTCGTEYHYNIFAKDVAGNESNMGDNTFETAECPTGDTTPPEFVVQVPAPHATGVSINPENLYVDFNESLDPNTISSNSVKLCLTSDSECATPVSIGSPMLMEGGKRIRLGGPSVTLNYSTGYWIEITTAVKDLAGNPIAPYGSTEDSNFTTKPEPTGELAIGTAVMIKADGLANDTYTNGWEWKLRITLPTDERKVALKFANWISGANTLAAGNNMQYYSEQISAGTGSVGTPVEITDNTYPDNVVVTGDADPSTPGVQTDIHIQVKIPAGTIGGAYSSAFSVKSTE